MSAEKGKVEVERRRSRGAEKQKRENQEKHRSRKAKKQEKQRSRKSRKNRRSGDATAHLRPHMNPVAYALSFSHRIRKIHTVLG